MRANIYLNNLQLYCLDQQWPKRKKEKLLINDICSLNKIEDFLLNLESIG